MVRVMKTSGSLGLFAGAAIVAAFTLLPRRYLPVPHGLVSAIEAATPAVLAATAFMALVLSALEPRGVTAPADWRAPPPVGRPAAWGVALASVALLATAGAGLGLDDAQRAFRLLASGQLAALSRSDALLLLTPVLLAPLAIRYGPVAALFALLAWLAASAASAAVFF
jgi:hypothetical protein